MSTTNIKIDLDDLWKEHDVKQNGYLDKSQSKKFVDKLAKNIDSNRASNYNQENFDTIFN